MLADKADQGKSEEQEIIDKINDENSDDEDDTVCVPEQQVAKVKSRVNTKTLNFYDGKFVLESERLKFFLVFWLLRENFADNEDKDDFMFVKRKNHDLEIEPIEEEEILVSKKSKKPISRAALAKKMLKKNILPNKKVVFNEEGEVRRICG